MLVKGQRYRLTSGVLGIRAVDGAHISVTLPADAVVELVGDPKDGNPLVEITSDGKGLLMFKLDIVTRGQEV